MAHTPTIKAEAIAALLCGESGHSVARRLGLPRSTVIRWRREGEQMVTNGPQKKKLGDQVEGLVSAGIQSLTAQVVTMADPEWLREQSARDMALLFGVVFDNSERLLRAMGPISVDIRD